MSTQYDSIVDAYAEFRQLPGATLERHNMYQAIQPYVKGASILDLACGGGQYSHQFVEWGASRVVGVDISEGMIAGAKAIYPNAPITFHAPSADLLKGMSSNICLNLKHGGRFFGITPNPTDDPARNTEAALKINRGFYKNITVEQKGKVDDGVMTRLTATLNAGKIEFQNYHLRKSVYEDAARAGGMEGELSWRSPTLPKGTSEIFAQEVDGPEEIWDEYCKVPHFCILTVEKG